MGNLPIIITQIIFWKGIPKDLFLLMLVWTLFWKGWALWRSARSGQKLWFVSLIVINTLGVLEILYLFVFSRKTEVPAIKKEEDLPMQPPEPPQPPTSTI